jgi:hypothetical protein
MSIRTIVNFISQTFEEAWDRKIVIVETPAPPLRHDSIESGVDLSVPRRLAWLTRMMNDLTTDIADVRHHDAVTEPRSTIMNDGPCTVEVLSGLDEMRGNLDEIVWSRQRRDDPESRLGHCGPSFMTVC